MNYRKFPGTDVTASALGMGCMRLPVQDVEGHPIDRPEAIRMIRHAIDNGVNYVDTAWGYHNEDSEVLVGEALQDGYREKAVLTSKLPVWKVEKYEDMERLLDIQLSRLQTDHLDFYLLHALDKDRFHKVVELGVFRFLDDMVKKGKIHYPGFSFHDDAEAFREIVDAYPWKLAQIQINVLDEFKQATYEGAKYAASKGIGVVVMEPLRGGSLTKTIPADVQELYDAAPVKRTPADWAFRWVIDKPEFITVLSGMSTMEQLDENIRIFSECEAGCLSEADTKLLNDVRATYERRVRVGCTGCEYCQPCPAEVKIPNIFRRYDQAAIFDDMPAFAAYYRKEVGENHCLECGACESACPQHIAIRDMLKQIQAEVNG